MSIPFWIYDDRSRHMSLVRGNVRDLLHDAGLIDLARWSTSGRGWVMSATAATDLIAYADYAGRSYRIKQVAE